MSLNIIRIRLADNLMKERISRPEKPNKTGGKESE